MRFIKTTFTAIILFSAGIINAQNHQQIEGFDSVVFHYNANRSGVVRDFRGPSRGYMTAGWWAAEQMKKNILSWKTAIVPEKKLTTFSFIGSSSVLPSEFSMGPKVKLTVNGNYALTFTLGRMRDFTWKEGDYELKYLSKRVEYPYMGYHRQFEIHGNSGIYRLTVPASAVAAGKPVVIEIEILPFEQWHNGWFMVKERRDVLKQSVASLQGEIGSLQADMQKINEQTHILGTQLYAEMLGGDRFQHHVIYTNGYRHLHPADLIKLKNGDILMMTREATEHFANDGDVVMLRSKDGGKTWGQRQVISAIKDLDEREGCGIQLKDGTIVVGVFYNDLYKHDGTYDWENRVQKTADAGNRYLGAHIITSKDNGHTWSKANFIDTKGMPFNNVEGPTDAPIEMPDGSLVMGIIGYALDGDDANHAAVMIRSTDKGKTWKYLSTMASDPGGKLGGFVEPGIVRTKTGRIIAGLRNGAPEGAIWMTYSDDNGKTWVPAWKTEMIGHPVDLIQLRDGRIMATYGIREGQHTTPGGIRACFSNDNGKTWDINTEVQIRNDFYNWDIGYPESLQLADGTILTAYYFNLLGKYFIGSTSWKP
jgi:sialidase-1